MLKEVHYALDILSQIKNKTDAGILTHINLGYRATKNYQKILYKILSIE